MRRERIIREIRRGTRVLELPPRCPLSAEVGRGETQAHRFDQMGRRYMLMEPLLNPAKQDAAA